MADSKTFVLVGNFQDNITPALNGINKTLDSVKRNLGSFSTKKGGFDDLTKSMGKVISAHKILNTEVKNLQSNLRSTIPLLKEYRSEVGKVISANTRIAKSGSAAAKAESKYLANAITSARQLRREYASLKAPRMPAQAGTRRLPTGGSSGGPPRGPRVNAYSSAPGRGSVLGDVVSGGLITQAIVSGFQIGVGILQKGMNAAFGAVAERTRDQLEDIASAGGIFSAAKFSKAKGLPDTFQGALDLQDDINKQVATIASNLPGTTQDFVMNARRMTDTLARIMADDAKGFMALAQQLTGNKEISSDKAFAAVNVEVSKATTLLEKLNPARTVVPMSQIVEDMMKQEQVTVGGLRKYVSFRRATTFESALTRNLGELNKAGAGTADRLKMIMKVLKEAVPPELIAAMTTSISGVVEGFKSSLLDPDVGIFGLSRTLSEKVIKFNRDTGKPMVDKFGNIIYDTTNFFKIFGEIFGNLGNLLNSSIMPGLAALYSPFESIANGLEDLRQKSWKIFERQQTWNKYFSSLAESKGMSVGAFKSAEKAGVTTLLEIMAGFKMMDVGKVQNYVDRMKKGGSEDQIAAEMKSIYSEIVPMFLNSPFIKNLGKNLGNALANIFKEIANLMDNVLHFKGAGTSEFVDAFIAGGGLDSINRIIVYLAEGLGKLFQTLIGVYFSSLGKAITTGNFGAAAVLGGAGFAILAPVLGSVTALFGDLKFVFTGLKTGLTSFISAVQKVSALLRLNFSSVKGPMAPLTPKTTAGAPKSAAFRAMAPTRIVNPQFPVALGQYKGVGGVTSPGRAPSIPGSRISSDLKSLIPVKEVKGFGASLSQVGNYLRGVGPRFIGFFKGFLGKLSIFGAVLTSVISLFQGKDLATSLAEGAGPLLGAALGSALIPFLGPFGPMLGAAIGGWVGSLDIVTKPLTEVFRSTGGALQGFSDSIAMIVTVTGDLFGEIGQLIGGIFGIKGEFDGLKIALAPITLAFQALELGLKGFALLLAETRVFFKRYFGSSEEYQQALTERDRLNISMRESQGRANAYNASMLGKENLKEQLNNAVFELQNSKTLKVARSAELKAFIEAARGELGDKKTPTQAEVRTSTQTTEINKKSSQQIKETGEVKKATDSTRSSVDRTTQAVNNLSARLTAQSPLQATAAAIYNLLASGTLRVLTNIKIPSPTQLPRVTTPPGVRPGAPKPLPDSSSGFELPRSRRNQQPGYGTGVTEQVRPIYRGSLGDAVTAELKHKPAGSNLVIANSSETIIPAAGGSAGAGMLDFVRTLQAGFSAVVRAVTDAKQIQQNTLGKINQTLITNQQQTNLRLAKLESKFSTPGLGGAMPSGGGVDAFNPVARQYGLTMTSGYRPGDPGWHGANRARDYSNSTGPTVQMLQFAKFMASTYGRNLKELIYTPLGFSIKNGQQVAPYAQGSHYNHVHVAYGLGAGNPAFFSSAGAADKWESTMARKEPIISSVRATANELSGGGTYNVTNNFTITQQPGQDPDTLASLVVMKLSMAIDEIRNHTA